MTDYIPSMSQVEAWLNEPLYATEAEIGKWLQLYSIDERRLQRLVQQIAADVAQNLQAPAEPEPEGPTDEPSTDDILNLAAIIREVDGNHGLGASALAEAILSHRDARWGNHRGILGSSSQPPKLKRNYLYSPVQIAECGGPCEQGPEHCDCGELWVEDSSPQLPSGEVAELVEALGAMAADAQAADYTSDAKTLRRVAELLSRLSPPQPIPVSERLPGDELCWWYEPDEDDGYGGMWTLGICGGVIRYSHWLPFNALPLPSGEVE